MRSVLMGLFSVLVASVLAFASQLEVISAKVVPSEVSAGESIQFVLEFSGKTSDIKEVIGQVREYPYEGPRIVLQPDKSSEKNLWILKSTVPFEAPSETFHIDFTAVGKDGKEIVTENLEKTAIGKTATAVLTVK